MGYLIPMKGDENDSTDYLIILIYEVIFYFKSYFVQQITAI